MVCLVLSLISKILAQYLISDLRALLASCDSASINGIGVLCLNEIYACSCRRYVSPRIPSVQIGSSIPTTWNSTGFQKP